MTTPKEALTYISNARWNENADLDDICTMADRALASLQGEDAVERVTQTIREYCIGVSPASIQLSLGVERIYYAGLPVLELARAILATGLASDEAAIRADEREKQKERDARILTAPVEGVELQRFICGGTTCTDTRGNDLFIAKSDVERLLTERAAAIRAGRGE